MAVVSDPREQAPLEARLQRAALLGVGFALPADRVATRRTTRTAARPDEDAITLAAEAAMRALPESLDRVAAIIFVSITPPYQEGGSAQILAELLGLQGDVFALDLTSTARDGLAAVRLAVKLAAAGGPPVLVCAAHAGVRERSTGDGAAALLIGAEGLTSAPGDEPLAILTPAASSAIEFRDCWRLPGDVRPREADRSFVQAIGTDRLVHDLIAAVPAELRVSPLVVGPDPRSSSALESELGGPGDPIVSYTGTVGAAHPLLRLIAGLDAPGLLASVASGLGEALHVTPTAAGAAAAGALRELAEHGGVSVERVMPRPQSEGFNPYASGPRAWRERGQDFRLEGIIGSPETPLPIPGRRHPTGTVFAWTDDRVYPAASSTEVVAIRIDGGGQFYGQVAMGEHVEIGQRVMLVPRRLHEGAGMIQYFWKVAPCP
jgi:hypothetical protein